MRVWHSVSKYPRDVPGHFGAAWRLHRRASPHAGRDGLLWRQILLLLLLALTASYVRAATLATVTVKAQPLRDEWIADAVIESTRQTVISAQTSGRITALYVKAGDHVAAGQRLLSIDQRTADEQLAASRAQFAAASAERDVAGRDLARTRTLFDKQYVSRAALDRAQARYRAAAEAASARQAEVRAALVQAGLHNIAAPYAGTIASVNVELGATAMPGAPLLTLYSPNTLRAVASVPQSQLTGVQSDAAVRVEIPDLPASARWQTATSVEILPVADPLSHSVQVRLPLPAAANQARPGMFARAYFPVGPHRLGLMVPLAAVVHRTEVTAVYVVAPDGQVTLRQVRLGETHGDQVEILAGLSAGERVALDPTAAARQ
ncbi:efflux RND transporter periplasmic adaptor subunit [Pandoraea sp.]|uniref:efflux RND transporter periplasmic adaptor subunit n=1 Tax=Pandoraea sp. TaxID=1883445 RepID=UPI0012033A8E|nr:efflux RND transporter periplasmic adaptor subunit [Pandoraea sp.]TAL53297.1 MAG: efflux RND transporter periplasmic adaptor subunit [Pandoraea sp.]TAM16664.1 MAG: efflux RND transporter periplasmic adaptor subunit [Pandoraea sp.]